MSKNLAPYPNLRAANRARQIEWDPSDKITLSYRLNELAGEVGEACNVGKKIERERLGIKGSRDTVEHLAEELADVVICADLVAMAEGIDLEAAVAAKFNATSEKVGLQTRLAHTLTAHEKSAVGGEVAAAIDRLQKMANQPDVPGFPYSQARYTDLRLALPALRAYASEPKARERNGVSRVMEIREEYDGSWVACSGCQESEDGHVSAKDYPYSAVFGCQPGGGCSECGGLGVKWDNTDWDAAARWMLEHDDDDNALSAPCESAENADKLRIAAEALEPFAAIASRYLTGGLRSDLESRSIAVIKHLQASNFYRALKALDTLKKGPAA